MQYPVVTLILISWKNMHNLYLMKYALFVKKYLSTTAIACLEDI